MYTKKCKYCGKYHAGKARTERKEAKKNKIIN
ncbi:Uncharacterised protein [[Clostridium] sordellii]|uniref:Uncharacterized protein n=1 Tax=Paraclostridium sordellii TaxID=1505 RepID=A0A0C7QZL0_PARSO|nr:Uncharacterised protein [[Clostridium] sordellii] [Paeniclostridium sordellii]